MMSRGTGWVKIIIVDIPVQEMDLRDERLLAVFHLREPGLSTRLQRR